MTITGRWIKGLAKDSAKRALLMGLRWKRTRPEVFVVAKRLLGRFPKLNYRIMTVVLRLASSVSFGSNADCHGDYNVDLRDCSVSVRKVYLDLKRAIEARHS
jgi:hypothetical protein